MELDDDSRGTLPHACSGLYGGGGRALPLKLVYELHVYISVSPNVTAPVPTTLTRSPVEKESAKLQVVPSSGRKEPSAQTRHPKAQV